MWLAECSIRPPLQRQLLPDLPSSGCRRDERGRVQRVTVDGMERDQQVKFLRVSGAQRCGMQGCCC